MTRNKVRIAVAVGVGGIAAAFRYAEEIRTNGAHSDFGAVWFGARSLIRGVNPYPLIGPGKVFDWDFHLNYPATALVAALPLSIFPEVIASILFVFLSATALTYAITRDDWNRIWILPSACFIVAARAAQWSPLYCASMFLPVLGLILSAKPTLGAVTLVSRYTKPSWRYVIAGAAFLLITSFILFPAWPREWLSAVRPGEFQPVFLWPGGFIGLLAALRWRQPEGRMVLAMSIVPITASWYEALPLLLAGRTKRETQILSLISSVGYITQGLFSPGEEYVPVRYTKILLVLFCTFPLSL
jgi:hypothetical protein